MQHVLEQRVFLLASMGALIGLGPGLGLGLVACGSSDRTRRAQAADDGGSFEDGSSRSDGGDIEDGGPEGGSAATDGGAEAEPPAVGREGGSDADGALSVTEAGPAASDAETGPAASDAEAGPAGDADATPVEPPLAELGVSLAGPGGGRVAADVGGLDCASSCSAGYPANTVVTLTATPDVASDFAGWTGACSGANPVCTVTLDQARTVQATFAPKQRSLTLTTTGSGSGTVSSAPAGIACPGDCQEDYGDGTPVTLTAAPDVGTTFGGWTNCPSAAAGVCTLTADAARTVTATFTLDTLPLSVGLAGTGTGSVASVPTGISCGADCSETYDYGTSVTLTATPAGTDYFGGYTGCPAASGRRCTVPMTSARSVTASFVPNQPPTATITSPSDGYAVLGYPPGTTVTLTGTGSDPEQGTLNGASLVWTTDRTTLQAASLGSGATITPFLANPYGCGDTYHTITLTVTDAKGATSSTSIVIDVYSDGC